jgi:uncharacterized membrane protein
MITPLRFDGPARWRVATVSAFALGGYVLAVCTIFYLSWTPIGAEKIWGLQGRYFLPALPLLVATVTATVNRGFGARVTAPTAIIGAVLSCAMTIEVIIRMNW